MRGYQRGLDTLSGVAEGGRGVLIRLHSPGDLVRQQGGKVGAAAQSIADKLAQGGVTALQATLEAKVYDEMAKKLASGLKEQGVAADVQVVTPVGYAPAGSSPIWKPLALGVTGAGVLALAWKLSARWRRR